MDDDPRRGRAGEPGEPDRDEGRAQHVEPERGEGEVPEPPADPDRPTDEVRRGNTLVEPAPGD